MAYQALYRKYRPSTFDEMAGQKQIVQTLQNAVEQDRISHAYLFCGPRGTGKTSTAKIFARALNCTSDGSRPCGHCENCKAADHPDIIEIDAASNNGVEEARNLVERVKYAPMLGKYKVYIIDEVHMMTAGAFNALLKTIEEPPKHVVFILATTEPHKVLPTILSRCQRFDFKKVPVRQIEERLLSIAQKEGTILEEDAASAIASLSDGGMRDALSILDQCIAYEPEHLRAEDVRAVYGVVSPADIAAIFSELKDGDAETVIRDIKKVYDDGMDLERFTADLITLLKDSLILQHSPKTTLLTEERKKLVSESFLSAPLAGRKELLQALMEVYPQFTYASSVLDYLESVFLRYMGLQVSDPQKMTDFSTSESKKSPTRDSAMANVKKPEIHIQKEEKKSNVISKSDVSRETSLKEEKTRVIPKKVRYSTDNIVGLLHVADKEMRKKDMNSWQNREKHVSSLKYGKFANLIRNASVAASGENYIVVHMPRKLEADAANDMQEACGFEDFLQTLTGVRKRLIAISSQEYKEAVDQFRQCMKRGEYPAPPEIHLRGPEKSAERSVEDQLRNIFPDLKIVDD